MNGMQKFSQGNSIMTNQPQSSVKSQVMKTMGTSNSTQNQSQDLGISIEDFTNYLGGYALSFAIYEKVYPSLRKYLNDNYGIDLTIEEMQKILSMPAPSRVSFTSLGIGSSGGSNDKSGDMTPPSEGQCHHIKNKGSSSARYCKAPVEGTYTNKYCKGCLKVKRVQEEIFGNNVPEAYQIKSKSKSASNGGGNQMNMATNFPINNKMMNNSSGGFGKIPNQMMGNGFQQTQMHQSPQTQQAQPQIQTQQPQMQKFGNQMHQQPQTQMHQQPQAQLINPQMQNQQPQGQIHQQPQMQKFGNQMHQPQAQMQNQQPHMQQMQNQQAQPQIQGQPQAQTSSQMQGQQTNFMQRLNAQNNQMESQGQDNNKQSQQISNDKQDNNSSNDNESIDNVESKVNENEQLNDQN